jgi:hypothetical protein
LNIGNLFLRKNLLVARAAEAAPWGHERKMCGSTTTGQHI